MMMRKVVQKKNFGVLTFHIHQKMKRMVMMTAMDMIQIWMKTMIFMNMN